MNNSSLIGVFDSGFGGLSVLKAMMKLMPKRRFVYLADIAYAPYGEQPDSYIIERSHQIAHFMHDELKTEGLVIACNTATAAAIHILRDHYGSDWPIIGTEPGLKPAAAISPHIAVMATHSTLQSAKFHTLVEQVQKQVQHPLDIYSCPCYGLAKAIDAIDENTIDDLVERYTAQIKATLSKVVVLGCTHYPLIIDKIQQVLPDIQILDTGESIARQVKAMLPDNIKEESAISPTPTLQAWTSGPVEELGAVIDHWMPETKAEVFFWNNGK